MTSAEAIEKLRRFCAYRERCHSEVRSKLLEIKVYGDQLEQVITELIKENYLNEERYARSYVRGKFKINRWGRNKIVQHLSAKHISEYCIRKAWSEIDPEEYERVLKSILRKYKETKKGLSATQLSRVLVQYAVSRGFELDIVYKVLPEVLSHK